VLLFFVHTSLVLNFSMVRLGQRGWPLFRSFLIRRAFRLYPLSILCVLLILVFGVPRMPWEGVVWRGWPNAASNLALTTNLTYSQPVMGPLWSLPVEAQMYVVLPIVFVLLGPSRNFKLAVVLWLVSAGAALIQPVVSDRLNVVAFAPCFMAGVLAFTLSGRVEHRFHAAYWLPFLIALIVTYLVAQNFAGGIFSTPLQWGFCLSVGLLLHSFRDSGSRWLNRAAHLIAKYSYGIYLFHCIALWIACFRLTALPEPLQWATAVVLIVFLSVAAFHLVEKPAIDFGARLASGMRYKKEKAVAIPG
jgi:peptidoglycan/LPS O-acetylase OafA/YrhL